MVAEATALGARMCQGNSFSAAVLCSLFGIPGRCEVGTQGVDYDGQSKDDQQECNDQLQSFYQEGSRACRIRFCQSDCALYQCGAGYAKHDYQRREQHLVAAACNLQEYAQRYKYQGRRAAGSQNRTAARCLHSRYGSERSRTAGLKRWRSICCTEPFSIPEQKPYCQRRTAPGSSYGRFLQRHPGWSGQARIHTWS